MNGHRRWTQTDITELRQQLAAGASLDGLVEALVRPIDDVRAMAGRLRIGASWSVADQRGGRAMQPNAPST